MVEFGELINKHSIKVKACPKCGTGYNVEGGGQKSGSSPAVLVPKEGRVMGFCSSQCLTEYQGGKIEDTLAYQFLISIGADTRLLCRGYLAPARIKQ